MRATWRAWARGVQAVAVAAVVIGGVGCSGPGNAETFADVQRAGGVPAVEVEALAKLLEGAGVEPAQFAVLQGRGGSLAKAPNGFLLEDGHVTAIKLSGTKLATTAALAPLKHLKGLSLVKNRLTSLEGLGGASSLLSVDVSHNKLTTLEGIGGCKQLRGLRASHNQLQTTKGLKGTTSIRSLILDHNQIADLADLAGHGQLVSLELTSNRLASLAGLTDLRRLKTIRLSENALTTTKGLGNLPGLEELYLDRNKITAMAGFPVLAGLLYLDLSHNELTSIAANAAATKGIVLAGNPLTAEARLAVQQAGPRCSVKTGFNRGLIVSDSMPIPCQGATCEKVFLELSDRIQLDLARSPHEKRPFQVRLSTELGSAKMILAHATLGHISLQAWPGRPCVASGSAIIGEPMKMRRRRRRRQQGPPPRQAFVLISVDGQTAKTVTVEIAPRIDGGDAEGGDVRAADAGVDADGGPIDATSTIDSGVTPTQDGAPATPVNPDGGAVATDATSAAQ